MTTLASETTMQAPRFAVTYCSQCGREFGPGNGGYSHCASHSPPRKPRRARRPSKSVGLNATGHSVVQRGLVEIISTETTTPEERRLLIDAGLAEWRTVVVRGEYIDALVRIGRAA